MSQQLVKSRMGRMLLHAVCLLLQPRQAHWHWCGIKRELPIVTPHGNVTSTTLFQVLPPPLSNTSSATNGLEVTWPATSSAFVLEVSEDLSAGSWKPVTEPLLMTNGVTRLGLAMPAGNRFYRLKTQ